jgi:CBS domain-containing protein
MPCKGLKCITIVNALCISRKLGLGLISDRDLLISFSAQDHEGILEYFASRIPFTEKGRMHHELRDHLQARTAAEVMNTRIITVTEDTTIDDAIGIMTRKALKRLPVLDSDGKFKGMISRDSILRTGFAPACPIAS